MKVSLAVAGVALIGATLTACGGDSQYCTDLKAAQDTFQDLDNADISALEDGFKTFHDLAAEAPDEIFDDWKVLDDLLTGAEESLEAAGITFEDLAGFQSGEIPEDVDVAKLQDVVSSFTELSSADTTEATQAIEDHAKDECDVELSSS